MQILTRKSIVKKTLQVGGYTFVSRLLGLLREMLMSRFLGAGEFSDAFVVAFRIPNALRKVFAEGALSSACVPTFIDAEKKGGKKAVSDILTVSFIIFEVVVILCSFLIAWRADSITQLVAPGFSDEQQALAVSLLRVLMPFIFFISSSSLISGALHTANHFFVPAIGSIVLNIFFIMGLIVGLVRGLSLYGLCYFILAGAATQLLFHVIAYFGCGFSLGHFTKQALRQFKEIIVKFLPVIITAGIMEVNFIIDGRFASFLEQGSITLLYYAARFMGIPLGVFGVAFSTILLPHFVRINGYAPSRMRFYILESAKLVFWVTIPASLMMCFFSETIFYTLFYSKKFTLVQVDTASAILAAYLIGLPFFALNKILQNVFYSHHNTTIPTIIALFSAVVHIILNWCLVGTFGAAGLAAATSVVGGLQALLSALWIARKFGIRLYAQQFGSFMGRYTIQLSVVLSAFYFLYRALFYILSLVPATIFFREGLGIWIWVGPLCLAVFLVLRFTQSLFGVQLYFLDK